MSSGILYVKDSRTDVQYEIPIRRNAVSAVDFKKIKGPETGADRADQVAGGLRVHDPGLRNTTVVETAISFSDHERSLLLFRGYSLEQLWQSDFEDVLHLLVWGSYPTVPQRNNLSHKLTEAMLAVPDDVQRTIWSLPGTSSPLPLIVAGLSACLASHPDMIPASHDANMYRNNPEDTDRAIIRTVAAYAVVFGLVNSHRKGLKFTPPSRGRSYYENLFVMAGLVDSRTGRPNCVKLSCFRRFSILNSDHGMALTVFSALATSSSLTDPISCLITAIGSAWGPLHFGATESAKRTLRDIGEAENIPGYIHNVKQGHVKMFGYGHRSYKGIDPRVPPIQSILKDLDMSANKLFKLAERIESACSNDAYFTERELYVNGDFYGHFIFTAIGFDPEIIPAAMLAQRIMGIMAHWREYMLTRGKLLRPSHIYTGEAEERLLPKFQQDQATLVAANQPATEGTSLLAEQPAKKPYSIFTPGQKRLIILTAALASSFSPLSANIYYPALNSIAADLHVTSSQINLTITTYMLCQGLAPAFMGSFADQAGRRPAYILCFAVYITGNIALALQHSYPALLILRAIQSCGSSGTVALASAVAADVITSAERGTYMGITSVGIVLAPSVGPLVGGILTPATTNTPGQKSSKIALPNPLTTLRLLSHLPTGLVLLSNGLLFASYYAVTAGIPSQFKETYHLNDFAIGLVFVPAGVGSLLSTTFSGLLLDWNYRRLREQFGSPILQAHQHGAFPIERARIQICLPLTLLAALSILSYSALMSLATPTLSHALVLIFAISFSITAAYNIMNILIVDLYYSTPATAMAANNLVRCFLGAAATGLVHPAMILWGTGWTYGTIMNYHLLISLLIRLITTQIIDPLPHYPQTLHLHYPNTPWIQPGDTLQILALPILSTQHLPLHQTYTILFLDLDVLYNHTTATVILHWYQPDLIPYPNNTNILFPNPQVPTRKPAPYIAPQPPTNSHHRYLYLLYTQPPNYTFPECFEHILPPTAEARAGFDMKLFADAAGLGTPVAGNWFYVRNEVDLPTGSGSGSKGGVATSTSMSTATTTTTSMRWVECDLSSSSSSSSSISTSVLTTSTAIAATTTTTHRPTDSRSETTLAMSNNIIEESQVQAQARLS
ncbi:citrate synthase [Aspergillus eucalypticola CBS 122712]|uniref:Citrate synthase n=1 Tax=Aspergillus eucalypticola (strain CBS 122712 / IBT 29274) TaxID=1448314 RepID=A0A317VNS8_ASPEC|nr:citrate synthase [Aspergillus eucalypticola CBS 122712]PWY74901.1 citrate synthase [Aspergillus eucalypticola CBS 122712]